MFRVYKVCGIFVTLSILFRNVHVSAIKDINPESEIDNLAQRSHHSAEHDDFASDELTGQPSSYKSGVHRIPAPSVHHNPFHLLQALSAHNLPYNIEPGLLDQPVQVNLEELGLKDGPRYTYDKVDIPVPLPHKPADTFRFGEPIPGQVPVDYQDLLAVQDRGADTPYNVLNQPDLLDNPLYSEEDIDESPLIKPLDGADDNTEGEVELPEEPDSDAVPGEEVKVPEQHLYSPQDMIEVGNALPNEDGSDEQDDEDKKNAADGDALSKEDPADEGPYPHPTPAALKQSPGGIKSWTNIHNMADVYFIAVVAGCSVAGVLGLIVAGFCWYRLQRNVKAASEVQYPAYGVTGPAAKEKPGSPGDRKLAQSAQMYHYQHQKQQMIAMEKAHGDLNKDGSEVDSEEENEEGDYTVFECPGLAPTGEMEVKNPLFSEDTPVTPSGGETQTDQPK